MKARLSNWLNALFSRKSPEALRKELLEDARRHAREYRAAAIYNAGVAAVYETLVNALASED